MKKIILAFFVMSMMISMVSALEVSINDYDPKPAEAGKYVNVWLRVENTGSLDVASAQLEVIPKDGLELASGEDAISEIGSLSSRDYFIVSYRLLVTDEALEGSNLIETKIYNKGTETSKDLFLEVTDKNILDVDLEIGNIQSEPTRIKPDDDDVKLVVTLQNLGDATAKSVKANLINLPEGVTASQSYSDLALLGNIEEDSTGVATFYIDVDESTIADNYEALLDVSYKYKPDEDEDDFLVERVQLPISINIKPIPLYKISKAVLDRPEIRAGDENVKLTLTITNVGQDEGEAVRVKIYGKSEHPFDFDVSSNYLAPSLKPGESAQTTLEFDVEEDAYIQSYLMDVEIKNLVENDVVTYDHTLPLDVKMAEEKSPAMKIIVIVVIVVLIGGVVMYMRRRDSKKSKKRS